MKLCEPPGSIWRAHRDAVDRLTAIGIGMGIILAVTNGTCSTNQRFTEINQRFTEMRETMETGFAAATQQRRNAAQQRRNEHDQIVRGLERLEDLHLEPA